MRALPAAVLVVFVAGPLAQAGRADGPVPDLPVHTVRVDAVATDAGGRAVAGLNAADFDLFEDGTPRALDGARLVDAEPRLFAIYLDEYQVSAGPNTVRVRDALTRFIDEELGPRDEVVVMKPLDSLFNIRLSRDREAAKGIVAAFDGRKNDYAPRTAYERENFTGTPARIAPLRAQITMSALDALARHLGGLGDGRKSLLVVTEDFVRTTRPRRQEYLTTFETVVRSANRSLVAVYPVDPAPEGAADSEDRAAMRALASDTAGQVVEVASLHRIAADAGAYYILTYRAPHREDGRYHEVLVRPRRPGLQVRARSGYWAPSADEAMRAALLARARAPAPPAPVVVPRHISTLVRPWIGLSRGDAGKTRVAFVWEPAGVADGRPGRRPSRLVLKALGTDGDVLFEGAVRPTGPGAIAAIVGQSGPSGQGLMPARAVFDVPPGRLQLQMTIEDGTEKELDVDAREIAVRDFGAGVTIATPQVLRARTAREFRLLDEDPDAVPVASREFSRAERLLVRVTAYAPDGARPVISARLLGPTGQGLRDLVVEVGPDGAQEVDVPLAGLAPNDYLLELTAKSPAGDAKDIVNFRVTN